MEYQDNALTEILNALKEGTLYRIDTAPVTHKQRLIIQYNDIIQGFDCGILAALAVLYRQPPYDSEFNYNKLNMEVMDKISFPELWELKDSDDPNLENNVCKVIQRFHKEANLEFTDEDTERLRRDIKKYMFTKDAPMVDLSPTLSFANGLLALYGNNTVKDILFVMPNIGLESKDDSEEYIKNAAKFLMGNFFPKEGDIPIYIDYNTFGTFYEYAMKMIETTKNTDDFVFVSTSKKLFAESFTDKIVNSSFIFPENDHMEIGKYNIALAGSTNYKNEYICYVNEPFRLEDPKL